MANKVFGEALLTLADGRELTMRFDFSALCEAEDACDKGTESMMREMASGGARLTTARAMLYGGLRHYHGDVTLDECGDLLMSDGDAISQAMGKAMQAMADRRQANPRPGAANAKKAPPHGIGIRSSKAGAKAA
jgi:hypothetical protein